MPSFEAKYAGVSEKLLRGIRLREQVSKVPSFPRTGMRVRPQEIPGNKWRHRRKTISPSITAWWKSCQHHSKTTEHLVSIWLKHAGCDCICSVSMHCLILLSSSLGKISKIKPNQCFPQAYSAQNAVFYLHVKYLNFGSQLSNPSSDSDVTESQSWFMLNKSHQQQNSEQPHLSNAKWIHFTTLKFTP